MATLLVLSGCDALSPRSSPSPQSRPPGVASEPADAGPRSVRSADLARYYAAVQADLLAQGLLRTDGGGPDTPFTADDLARNFEAIALHEEYNRDLGTGSSQSESRLSRWSAPVRVGIEFGPSVSNEQRGNDRAAISAFATRVGRLTGHPVSNVRSKANFHVFVASEDDSEFLQTRLRQLVPDIGERELSLFKDLPRSYYCFVVAFSGADNSNQYTRAIALVRAEHPDLMRLSCVHEEIAQGMGLPNDSPAARPSIFNDDDEFALLTNHDELLLRMLYDPRMTPGMTPAQARPVARIIARDLMGLSL